MITVEIDRTFSVPAADVWARIGDFYDLSWAGADAVAETRKVADRAARVAVLPDGAGEVVEDLVEQGDRFYRYEVTEPGPMPLSDFKGHLRVEELDPTTSRVVWQARFEPAGISDDEARTAISDRFTGCLENLAQEIPGNSPSSVA